MSEHLNMEIELYALGDLGSSERRAVEVHVAACDACARSLGEAESSLASLSSLLPVVNAPANVLSSRRKVPISAIRPYQRPLGVAASFILGALLAGGSVVTYERSRQGGFTGDVRAQIAMTHAHFRHAQLTAAPGGPQAKIVYAASGGWLYAIVDGSQPGDRLVAINAAAQRDFGPLVSHGASASLFVEGPGAVREIAIMRGETIVAHGALR